MRLGTIKPKRGEVKRRRELIGWTQEELADKIGCNKKNIENAEAGRPQLLRTLREIAQALECDLKDLVDDETQGRASATVAPLTRSALIGNAPSLPSLLVGRDTDLATLCEKLCRDIAPVDRPATLGVTTVRGWPGVGKTTLARALAHAPRVAARFTDGVLWTTLGPSPSLLKELHAWGRALHDTEVPLLSDISEASLRLAGLVRDRRVLLIVDDVWQVDHVQPFAIGGRHCGMIVTTRFPLVADAFVPTPGDIYYLGVLSEADSLTLLRTLAPQVVAQYETECRDLAVALEGLPLALQVAGRMLHGEQSRGRDVGVLLAGLQQDIARLLSRRAPLDMALTSDDMPPTVSAVLAKSTDCLTPMVRKRFTYLAPFAPRPATFDFSDIKAVWQVSDKVTTSTIDVLVDRGLLEPIGEGRYQIHMILVQHAKNLLAK